MMEKVTKNSLSYTQVPQEWPGLPRGVKFDPSDQEIIWHLLTKVDALNLKPHPFLDEFISTVDNDDGICYTHPQNLPGQDQISMLFRLTFNLRAGKKLILIFVNVMKILSGVKQDGSVSHFFHRAIKAYNSGTRKRRKIHGNQLNDVRWHKTGRTKPVILDGVQKGCKKIMVLYLTLVKGEKAEKTNWVMHQYHLGIEENEKDGEYVISKVFYQQNSAKQGENSEAEFTEISDMTLQKVDPVSSKSVSPEPICVKKILSVQDNVQKAIAIQVEFTTEVRIVTPCL